MSSARDNVLFRVRKALGKRERDIAGLAAAEGIIAGHAQGPRPRLAENRVEHFMQRARDMESTVERVVDRRQTYGRTGPMREGPSQQTVGQPRVFRQE